jgi:3-methyl-2-oxobutanoate hydroxymethyltransferase
MLTAYDYPTGLHADRAGVDVVLVGDSLGMVVLGHDTTQPVTLDDMAHHTRAARRGVSRALLVADLPFGSYEASAGDAMRAAYRLVKEAGADAVKLEGGSPRRIEALRAVVDGGVAVMAHVGLTPQAVSVAGGFRSVGRDAAAAARVLDEALALQDAGAFGVVIECVPPEVARVVTDALEVPTIGIGAGLDCTGQVLVYHDMLGLMAHPHHTAVAPKFSKQFAHVGPIVNEAIRDYRDQVRCAAFPSAQYSPYRIPEGELQKFQEYAARAAGRPTASRGGGTGEAAEGRDGVRLY